MAAPILSYEDLGLIQGAGWLFRGLDLYIGARDRLALIGRNGAGKTTLLKCLAGMIDPDEGQRTIVPGTQVVLLEQDPRWPAIDDARGLRAARRRRAAAHEAEAIADQLGIDLSRAAATASGGERRRAAIARALAQDPDMLLLDEPTNHLDLGAIEWLEDWLKRFKGAFVVISHDRTFLTRLTKQHPVARPRPLRRAEIGFGGFEAWTERVYAEEARAAEKLDAKLKLEQHWLQRGVTARRRRNQGRLAKLHEMRAQRAAMLGPQGTAKLALAKDDVRSKTVIDAEQVTKTFRRAHDHPRLHAARHSAATGSASSAPNGAGKTTLAQAADRRACARQRHRHAGQDARRHRDRPAAQADGARQARAATCSPTAATGSTCAGSKKHIQGYLKEFLFDPALTDAPIGIAVGRRALAAAARARIRAACEPAGARRADQRSRPRDARPAAGSDRRL